jgi:hypothetical protein
MAKVKVVYNACYGGYGLSVKAKDKLRELGVKEDDYDMDYKLPRHDPRLIKVVEELGTDACGDYAELKICKIKGNKYRIDEYDGNECVQEPENIVDWIIAKIS